MLDSDDLDTAATAFTDRLYTYSNVGTHHYNNSISISSPISEPARSRKSRESQEAYIYIRERNVREPKSLLGNVSEWSITAIIRVGEWSPSLGLRVMQKSDVVSI